MERLTKKHERGYYMTIGPTERGNYDAIQRLGELEDAEEQGLLIRLPCKVGDTVFVIASKYHECANMHDCNAYDFENYLISWCREYCPYGYRGIGVVRGKASEFEVNEYGVRAKIITENGCLWREIDNFFPCQEEAEAALEKMNNMEVQTWLDS